MTKRHFLPLGLVLATLMTACTSQELEMLGRVLLEESLEPTPTTVEASPAPGASATPAAASPSPVPSRATVAGYSEDERELHQLLMAYRAEKGLAAIPLSPSLTTVARAHVADLIKHPPDGKTCNLHTWSSDGDWSSGCYTRDHAQASIMWDKPRELTTYPGNGYEIAVGYYGDVSGTITPEGAMTSWKGSAGHNAVMINAAPCSDTTWRAVGVGIDGGYATVWFGKEADPAL